MDDGCFPEEMHISSFWNVPFLRSFTILGYFIRWPFWGKDDNRFFYNPSGTLSNEKRAPGWLCYIGDEILPSYIGIIINHYKDPY